MVPHDAELELTIIGSIFGRWTPLRPPAEHFYDPRNARAVTAAALIETRTGRRYLTHQHGPHLFIVLHVPGLTEALTAIGAPQPGRETARIEAAAATAPVIVDADIDRLADLHHRRLRIIELDTESERLRGP